MSPPGRTFDLPCMSWAVMQMTPDVWDGLGLGEVALPDGLGVWDGLFDGLGVPVGLGVREDVLCDGLGVWARPAWVSLTAENVATDPDAHGELADAAGAATAASTGVGAEPGRSKE